MLQLEQIPSFCTVCYLLFYVFTHMCDIIPLPDNLNCDIVLITVNGTLCFKYFSSSPKLCVFSFLYIALFMSILLFSSLFLFSFFLYCFHYVLFLLRSPQSPEFCLFHYYRALCISYIFQFLVNCPLLVSW